MTGIIDKLKNTVMARSTWTESIGVNIHYHKESKQFYQRVVIYSFNVKAASAYDFNLSWTLLSEEEANHIIEKMKLTKSEDDRFINYDSKQKLKMLSIRFPIYKH